MKNWQFNTGDTTPDDLTPDWVDRETGAASPWYKKYMLHNMDPDWIDSETGKALKIEIEQKRGTMPGIMIINKK